MRRRQQKENCPHVVVCVSPAVYDALLFACIGKRKGWVYELVDETLSSSKYWAAPIESSTLFISGGEGSAAVLAKAPKKRPLLMMSEREADEKATHREVLIRSPELHYVSRGVHCCCLFMFFPCVQTHRTLLPPDDEAKSQDAEESKSEAMMKVDNVPSAASIPTSLPIAATLPTPVLVQRLRPISEDWEAYHAFCRVGRGVGWEAFKASFKDEQAPLEQKQATRIESQTHWHIMNYYEFVI